MDKLTEFEKFIIRDALKWYANKLTEFRTVDTTNALDAVKSIHFKLKLNATKET